MRRTFDVQRFRQHLRGQWDVRFGIAEVLGDQTSVAGALGAAGELAFVGDLAKTVGFGWCYA